MSDTIALIAAISPAAVLAAVGAWRTEATARWQARRERLRTDAARRENELHRQRFAELWNWQRDQPAGPERTRSARWYGEWTGRDKPYRGGLDPGPLTPGLHSADADDAYNRYVEDLAVRYQPNALTNALPVAARRRSGLRRLFRGRKPGDQVT